VTDDWFRRRSSDWTRWDLAALIDAKAARGCRVSVVVPARDEAATVGEVVTRLRADLMGARPLVDELVVIDSDSSDATARVAADAGAVVHAASGIRPDLGVRTGKGEAMWKSLFVTTGDLLVFMDADLTAWETHFVTGLLGPLLLDDGVDLVKAYYDRPLATAPDAPLEGGRVTELVARPLLSLHWPELAGVVQPLAGEWAIRRDLFEELAVPCGYGVELAVLVDTYLAGGLDAIAQVDLGLRGHSHQSLRDLGVMALQQLAVVEERAGVEPGAGVRRETLTLRQYESVSGRTVPVDREVQLSARPPVVDVPGYRPGAVADLPDAREARC